MTSSVTGFHVRLENRAQELLHLDEAEVAVRPRLAR
jgi:hypothetical protein